MPHMKRVVSTTSDGLAFSMQQGLNVDMGKAQGKIQR